MKIKYFIQWSLFIFLISTAIHAAIVFPRLTGRVVDNAHILSNETIQQLDSMLANYENGTTNQVVVVTLPSLQGNTIEDFGYQLGRHWGIGQKGKDNGVLLIVAPHERKARIEVGYGLEPVLTDAISSTIMNQMIVPAFRNNDYNKGVIDGTQAIIDVLGGKSLAVSTDQSDSQATNIFAWIFILGWLGFAWLLPIYHTISGKRGSSGGFFSGGSGGGFFGSGGFGGGGGGFGGGGCSGSW